MSRESIEDLYSSMIIGDDKLAAVVTFAHGANDNFLPTKSDRKSKNPWAEWFPPDNNEPNSIIRAILKSNINPGIIQTKVDFIVGDGLRLFRKVIVNGKEDLQMVSNPNIEGWLKKNKVNILMQNLCKDYIYFGNYFVELIYSQDGSTILSAHHKDASLVRAKKRPEGSVEIPGYFLCSNWQDNPRYVEPDPKKKDKKDTGNVFYVPAFKEGVPASKAIYHGRNYTPGQAYYALPDWYGCMNWIQLANEIPLWHLNGIKNGYNIRYHVQIPMSYFDRYKDNEKAEKREELRSMMTRWLSGAEGSGKTFLSFIKTGANENDKFIITPISADLKDDAYSAIFEQSNQAMTSGHGISPPLAGIETAGKLSSGSEMRMAYQIYCELKTPGPRAILLQWLEEVWKKNNWPADIYPAFVSRQITTLDKNPNGVQTGA